jgi:threonine dehydrogenase-like Zn-dependent dehydrogenase
MEMDCLLPFSGDSYFGGALAEPLSCVAGTYHAMYHATRGSYEHKMGIKEGGKMAILAGVGPMGLAAIDYIIHADLRPSLIAVTDIDDSRLKRDESILTPAEAAKNGVKLVYMNTGNIPDPKTSLIELSGAEGYDDVLVFAPVAPVVELADSILAQDGCLNFFAGPSNPEFSAKFNFYNVHYSGTHVVGTSGGNTADMREVLAMMSGSLLDPSILVTHIGGLDAAGETTLNLPKIPGAKKLIYTGISLPLTAISDFEAKGKSDPLFAKLHELTAATNGLWNTRAEKYLLASAKSI